VLGRPLDRRSGLEQLVFGHADRAGQAVLETLMGLYRVDETSPYGGGPSREVMVRTVTIEVG